MRNFSSLLIDFALRYIAGNRALNCAVRAIQRQLARMRTVSRSLTEVKRLMWDPTIAFTRACVHIHMYSVHVYLSQFSPLSLFLPGVCLVLVDNLLEDGDGEQTILSLRKPALCIVAPPCLTDPRSCCANHDTLTSFQWREGLFLKCFT